MKNLSKLGKALSKAEQKTIAGGAPPGPPGRCCDPNLSCCKINPSSKGGCRYLYSNNECI